MNNKFELRPLSIEKMQQLTNELTAILEKYNCEMGVKSTIELLERVEIKEEITKEEGIPSPFLPPNGESDKPIEETPKTD